MQVVSAAVGVRACKECACGLKLSWSGCILSWSGCMWSEASLEWLHKIKTVQVVSAAVGVRACKECASVLRCGYLGKVLKHTRLPKLVAETGQKTPF